MKRICCIALLCAVVILGGCSAEGIVLPDAAYSLSFAEEYIALDGNNVKLMYPVVSGYANTETEEAVNLAARALALDMYRREGLMADSDGGYTYTPTDAVVTLQCDTFYSVCIGGTVSSDVSGGTEWFAFSLNCDLSSGTFLSAEDVIANYAGLRKMFIRGKFTQDFGYDNLVEHMTEESLLQQYKAEYDIYPPVYFREGKLGFLVETVPLLDGYAGFTVNIRKAAKYINTQNAAMAKLCGMNG